MKNVKVHLLHTLNELFCGELGFIQIIHETNCEKPTPRLLNDMEPENANYSAASNYDHPKFGGGITQVIIIFPPWCVRINHSLTIVDYF